MRREKYSVVQPVAEAGIRNMKSVGGILRDAWVEAENDMWENELAAIDLQIHHESGRRRKNNSAQVPEARLNR